MRPRNAEAVHVGVASHNVFDVAYALLLRAERALDDWVSFEMLEGMADPIRRVVQAVSTDMLLYCPAATNDDFASAIAYLVRRLDENTAPENFLRHAFDLSPGSPAFESQSTLFVQACLSAAHTSTTSRRSQDRTQPTTRSELVAPYRGEESTDWTSAANRMWIRHHLNEQRNRSIGPIPLALAGTREVLTNTRRSGHDPSELGVERYTYCLADWTDIDTALTSAKAAQTAWARTPVEHRADLLLSVAHILRQRRGTLLAAMVLDGGKTVEEADPELCEAIDFLEYYARSALDWSRMPGLCVEPLGTVLVTPPWNFPLAIPLKSPQR